MGLTLFWSWHGLSPWPLSGMLFPTHHLKNLKATSQETLTQQRQEDDLEGSFHTTKMSLWTGLDDTCKFVSFYYPKLQASLVFSLFSWSSWSLWVVEPLSEAIYVSSKAYALSHFHMSSVSFDNSDFLLSFGHLFWEREGWGYCEPWQRREGEARREEGLCTFGVNNTLTDCSGGWWRGQSILGAGFFIFYFLFFFS